MTEQEAPLKTYADVKREVDKWFRENIDEEYLKELMKKPIDKNSKVYKAAEAWGKLALGAYVTLPLSEDK